MDRCDIIIPVWNQLEVTRECIASILRNTDNPYRLILIDNGSDISTELYLGSLRGNVDLDVVLIRNQTNLGFVKAVNQGIQASDAPYVCIMNNDTIASRGWLREMIEVIESMPEVGLVNPSSNTSGQFPKSKESIELYAADLKKNKGRIQELYTCRGFCMLLKKTVVEDVGLLDEIYHLGYFDDTDYCKRAQGSGYRTVRAKGAYVYHMENTSFKELAHNKALFEANESIFFKKWGRPLRVAYLISGHTPGSKVDDIAINVARSGHQITIFMKRPARWPVTIDHFDIRRMDISALFFYPISLYKILKRIKKKRFHLLLTDIRLFGLFLRLTKRLHGSEIIVTPRAQGVLEKLNYLSRQI